MNNNKVYSFVAHDEVIKGVGSDFFKQRVFSSNILLTSEWKPIEKCFNNFFRDFVSRFYKQTLLSKPKAFTLKSNRSAVRLPMLS